MKNECQKQVDDSRTDYDHKLTQSKDEYKKAFAVLQKESSEAKLNYESQISQLKAQCEDDHTVASLRKEED